MGMSFDDRKKLLADTQHAAAALIEDMAHVRDVVNSTAPQPSQIRLLSNILRRILVNRELTQVAAPRLGKIHLFAPDNSRETKEVDGLNVLIYQTGSPLLFPILKGFCIGFHKSGDPEQGTATFNMPWRRPEHFDPVHSVRLDGFLTQRVLCFRDRWATRLQIIKYAAICASGVHTEAPRSAVDKMLAQSRLALLLTQENGNPAVKLDVAALGSFFDMTAPPEESSFSYDPNRIDVVFVELLAAAFYLCRSPDVAHLEEVIRAELGIARPSEARTK